MLLRWNGCRWEPKRVMNTQRMKTLEARTPRASAVGVSKLKRIRELGLIDDGV